MSPNQATLRRIKIWSFEPQWGISFFHIFFSRKNAFYTLVCQNLKSGMNLTVSVYKQKALTHPLPLLLLTLRVWMYNNNFQNSVIKMRFCLDEKKKCPDGIREIRRVFSAPPTIRRGSDTRGSGPKQTNGRGCTLLTWVVRRYYRI